MSSIPALFVFILKTFYHTGLPENLEQGAAV